jgi:hypothetical protein
MAAWLNAEALRIPKRMARLDVPLSVPQRAVLGEVFVRQVQMDNPEALEAFGHMVVREQTGDRYPNATIVAVVYHMERHAVRVVFEHPKLPSTLEYELVPLWQPQKEGNDVS